MINLIKLYITRKVEIAIPKREKGQMLQVCIRKRQQRSVYLCSHEPNVPQAQTYLCVLFKKFMRSSNLTK